jgi:hypothetical protein
MKLKLPKDFKSSRPMPQEVIDRYGKQISPELLDFWQETGLGTFANGFMKVINPLAVTGALGRLFEGTPLIDDVPIFATAFGDFITYSDITPDYNGTSYGGGTYYGINFRRRIISEVGVRLPYLMHDLTGGFFQKEMLSPEGYASAVEVNRKLKLHECFVSDAARKTFGVMELSEFIDDAERGAFGAG